MLHHHHTSLHALLLPRRAEQVQREKQDLENLLEAEQECLVLKMQAKMSEIQRHNRSAYSIACVVAVSAFGLGLLFTYL